MNDNKFKLLLGGIALAADSLFFDSFLSKIKEELLILCISLAVLSLIYLGIRKLVLHKSIAMTKTMGILVISMIIVLSIGINYLISPKKEIPPTNSLTDQLMTYLTTIKNTRILDWKTHKCSLSTCIANRESLTKEYKIILKL